jgi:serine protease Do
MKTGFQRPTAAGFALLVAIALVSLLSAAPAIAREEGMESLRQSGQAFRGVAKKVSPAVVFIQVEQEVAQEGPAQSFSPFGSPFDDEFFRHFFGGAPQFQRPRQAPQKRRSVGQGSGFIISSDGYILTNNHVVEKADKVRVKTQDGREYTAKVVGADPPSDLAVIKIEESDLPFLRLGDSDKLEVGDWVLAVGNPFGLSHTLTAGIVSAKGRSGIGLNDYENFIQTDAAINPGNSGGPLVNLDGEAVGINTAIFSRSGGYMGIGFAIPVNMARQIRDQLIERGEVTRGRLGVYIQDLTKELARSFGLEDEQGILVSQVIEGSPAEKAGLERGDIIQRLDGNKVDKGAEVRNRIALTAPGSKIKLDIVRDGKPMQITATIGKLESDGGGPAADTGEMPRLGLKLRALTPELAERLGYREEQGVLVDAVDPESPAGYAGIERGDLIQEIDRLPVADPDEAHRILAAGGGKIHLLLIRHGEATRYLTLKIED